MDREFWIKKWEKGETRFHQDKVHSELLKHVHRFRPGTILVPLSGKSLDMIYLASHKHKVIGVELSELACRAFFDENKIPFTTAKTDQFLIFQSENITIYCGDFFALPETVWKEISGIYDRAALIALPPELRQKYVRYMNQFPSKETAILLIAIEYSDPNIKGPPFSVNSDEVKSSYSTYEITHFKSYNPKVVVHEHVYWMIKS